MTSPRVGDWMDRRERPIPQPLRRRLTAAGPVSVEMLVQAAEAEARRAAPGRIRDREAAFGVLAADSYISYACLYAVLDGGDGGDLAAIARRIASAAWRE